MAASQALKFLKPLALRIIQITISVMTELKIAIVIDPWIIVQILELYTDQSTHTFLEHTRPI